jgi:hypothetical protein
LELSNMLATPGFPCPLPCSQPQASERWVLQLVLH